MGCEIERGIKIDPKDLGMSNRKYAYATSWESKCLWEAGNEEFNLYKVKFELSVRNPSAD